MTGAWVAGAVSLVAGGFAQSRGFADMIDPWVGIIGGVVIASVAVWKVRQQLLDRLGTVAATEARDRDTFRQSMLAYIGHLEDKVKTLEHKMDRMEDDHRKEVAEMSEEVARAQRDLLERDRRIMDLTRGQP